MSDKPTGTDNDFQSITDSIEKLVRRVEDGDVPLEDSIESYESGIALVREAQKLLSDAEQKVTHLTEQGAGDETLHSGEEAE